MLYNILISIFMWSLCTAFKTSLSSLRLKSFRLGVPKQYSGPRDTIYALGSGPVTKSGVSVIRISGPSSLFCLQSLCNNATTTSFPKFRERYASLRKLYDPKTLDTLDQSLVLWFPGPHSFTGEDVVELHVHGSRAVVAGVLGALEYLDTTSKKGIRPAERGEFTRRAFENGKMDLTGVEGLADLLDAQTAVQRKQALRQIDGHLTRTYDRWRSELVRCLAHTEAVIDFGDDDREDDVRDDALDALIPRVKSLLSELEQHLHDGRKGEIVRDGVRIALAGPPNAGKSSLLNALARRPAAIVSPIAGTTRDVVAVHLDLAGVPCIVSDTAGLRSDSSDLIELEGMNRARDAFRQAHIKLFVVDSSQESKIVEESLSLLNNVLLSANSDSESDSEEGEDESHEKGEVLIVKNKADLVVPSSNSSSSGSSSSNGGMDGSTTPSLSVSCLTGQGFPELESALTQSVERLLGQGVGGVTPIITRQRHRRHVQQCIDHLKRFLYHRLPVDLAAEELRFAMVELGKVTGVVDVEELLDVMFRDFCIGK